jgi:hypothetical protein
LLTNPKRPVDRRQDAVCSDSPRLLMVLRPIVAPR